MASDLLGRIRERLTALLPSAGQLDPDFVVPADVCPHLINGERMEPLWPQSRRFGKGKPGVTRETPETWVVRDKDAAVVGGVIADPNCARASTPSTSRSTHATEGAASRPSSLPR